MKDRLARALRKYNRTVNVHSLLELQRECIDAGILDPEEYLEHKLGPAKVPSTPAEKVDYTPTTYTNESKKGLPRCYCGNYTSIKWMRDATGKQIFLDYAECKRCGHVFSLE